MLRTGLMTETDRLKTRTDDWRLVTEDSFWPRAH